MISENNNNKSVKQAYHQPEFHIYGNVSNLTNNVGSLGNTDGGSDSANKTRSSK